MNGFVVVKWNLNFLEDFMKGKKIYLSSYGNLVVLFLYMIEFMNGL